MTPEEYTRIANEHRGDTPDIDPLSPTWRAISRDLEKKKASYLDRLASPQSGREEDLGLKGKLALIRDLLKLAEPRS